MKNAINRIGIFVYYVGINEISVFVKEKMLGFNV